MKWLLILTGLLAAACCQGCRQGGPFGQAPYGYYGSYPMATPPVTYPSYTGGACGCQ